MLDQALLGETGVAGHALADPAFSLFLVVGHGVVPLTNPTLSARDGVHVRGAGLEQPAGRL